MAQNVTILNPADPTKLYLVAVGEGAPAETDDMVVSVKKWGVGSQYLDKEEKKLYVRCDDKGEVADWSAI